MAGPGGGKAPKQSAAGEAQGGGGFEFIETSRREAFERVLGMRLRAQVAYVRVGFDFEGSIIDTGGLSVRLYNRHMDQIYNPGFNPKLWPTEKEYKEMLKSKKLGPEAARTHYRKRSDLKGQRTWYLPYGLTAEPLVNLINHEFARVANGGSDRMLAIKDTQEFLGIFDKFPGSGILTAAPHRMEDTIKDYVKNPTVVGMHYKDKEVVYVSPEDKNKEGGHAAAGVKAIQIDCDSIDSTLKKYAGDQVRYNILVDDSGVLGKAAYEAWAKEGEKELEVAATKLILIENPENESLMARVKARPEIAAYGAITIVQSIDEAIETLDILYSLIETCSIEPGRLIEDRFVGPLICYAHLQTLKNIQDRKDGNYELERGHIDEQFLANLQKDLPAVQKLIGIGEFRLPNNEGLDLAEIERARERQRRLEDDAKLNKENEKLRQTAKEINSELKGSKSSHQKLEEENIKLKEMVAKLEQQRSGAEGEESPKKEKDTKRKKSKSTG
ncbi:MAG: hypothetical protein KGH58_00425 [Candidatus Micrarchaeota archaeon]|nr:hypothetical protein [Candidatus Micrarchaeota archaeon]